MPFSFLTRLRGAIIVAAFAFALLCLDFARQEWVAAAALSVLPLLVWLLVSNAVKEAPPFDDTAFHRTRPVTAGQVFRHLAGFHLLVLAGMLLVVLLYGWHYNLSVREIALGMIMVAVPWIALVALFATMASLSTSATHWKGWGYFMLLMLPAVSVLGLCWYFRKNPVGPSVIGVPLAGAVIYPVLWWLVMAKRRWGLGCLLGLVAGIAIPWISLPIGLPNWLFFGDLRPRSPELSIRRLKDPADVAGMVNEQPSVSRTLEVRGLGPDEFIGGVTIGFFRNPPWDENQPLFGWGGDPALGEMVGTSFSSDADGRLIPATASLFQAMNAAVYSGGETAVWEEYGLHNYPSLTLAEVLEIPVTARRGSGSRGGDTGPSEIADLVWSMGGSTFRWVKILETTAKQGGRAKLPEGGLIRMEPLFENPSGFALAVRVSQGRYRQGVYGIGPVPLLITRMADGQPVFIKLTAPDYDAGRRGFLIQEREFEFNGSSSRPQTFALLDVLRDARVELYWPEFRGHFQATLPPPE